MSENINSDLWREYFRILIVIISGNKNYRGSWEFSYTFFYALHFSVPFKNLTRMQILYKKTSLMFLINSFNKYAFNICSSRQWGFVCEQDWHHPFSLRPYIQGEETENKQEKKSPACLDVGWDRKSGLKMVWAAENMVSFTERGRKCSKFVKCIERLLIKKYMWNTHIKDKCQRDGHLVEHTGKLTPHFSPSHKKNKTSFLLWKFQCNELSTFYQREKSRKLKDFQIL